MKLLSEVRKAEQEYDQTMSKVYGIGSLLGAKGE